MPGSHLPKDDVLGDLRGVPLIVLRTEIERREGQKDGSSCGSTSNSKHSYNTPLHVFALILILALSTLACSFPIIARRFPRLPIPHRFLFVSRHFGTGVLIATAFVHLLPTAFVSLTDPCLPRFWNVGYPAMAGLIAMVSVLTVVTIEMFFAIRGAGHVHGSDWDTIPDGSNGRSSLGGKDAITGPLQRREHPRPFRQGSLRADDEPGTLTRRSGSMERLVGNGHITSPEGDVEYPESDDDDLENLDPLPESSIRLNTHDHATKSSSSSNHPHPHPHSDSHHPYAQDNPRRLLLQCLLLEAGILFHSVFIGMALSVSTGTPFIVLLIAISFHQTFEGLALGSRIAALIPDLFSPSSPRPWLMALAYGTTTPIGQAIGLGLHRLYDPASTVGLLMVGITNAISSGLLLFAGLVELLAEDFLSDKSYEVLKGRRRVEAGVAVAAGGALMALVGAWA